MEACVSSPEDEGLLVPVLRTCQNGGPGPPDFLFTSDLTLCSCTFVFFRDVPRLRDGSLAAWHYLKAEGMLELLPHRTGCGSSPGHTHGTCGCCAAADRFSCWFFFTFSKAVDKDTELSQVPVQAEGVTMKPLSPLLCRTLDWQAGHQYLGKPLVLRL